MKKQRLYAFLFTITAAGILAIGCTAAPAPIAEPDPTSQVVDCDVRCSQPTEANADYCQQIEEQILKSTVRIRIDEWFVKTDESGYVINSVVGHATLMDGRYLVTHNHFDAPLAMQAPEGAETGYRTITLFNSQGETCYQGPLAEFDVVWSEPETLVIAHEGEGFFEELGFVSAEFKDWSSVPLAAGMEVAQVDWDGMTERVDWTNIEDVAVAARVPCLVLDDGITMGASGGGVFLQGVHIAHNWRAVEYFDEAGDLVDAASRAALDSGQVIDHAVPLPAAGGVRAER